MLKYFNRRRKKGQSTLEYAILIVIILGALIAIQQYIKRGVQGRMKSATDDVGDQYSPGNMNYVKITRTSGRVLEQNDKGTQYTKLLNDEVTNTVTNMHILNIQWENWGG